MHPSSLLIQAGIWIVLGLSGGYLLARRGYSAVTGILLGVLCGPIGLIFAFFMPRTTEARRSDDEEHQWATDLETARKQKACPKCGCRHSVANRFCPSCMYDYDAGAGA